MFFLISKIVGFLFSPFAWLVFIMLAYFFLKKEKVRKWLKITFLLVFFIFSYKPIVLLFISGWEEGGKNLKDVEHCEVGIVLGGGFEYDNDRERLSIRRAGDRIWTAVQLYHMGKIEYILLTGKNGDLIDKGLDESNQLKEILILEGIPKERILVDSESINTYENAVHSKAILDSMQLDRVLLITSALHMKRAFAVFQKQGIQCEQFATDFYSGGYSWDQFFFPSTDAFGLWEHYLHEVFGYVTYSITGKL